MLKIQHQASAGRPPNLVVALTVAVLIGAILYLAREILVPLALAILLSFVLSPLVVYLRGLRVPRAPAVLLVVTLTFIAVAALGAVMGRQVTDLVAELPRYESTLRHKIQGLRPAPGAPPGIIERASEALEGLSRELDSKPREEPGRQLSAPAPRPIPVELHQPPSRALGYYQTIIAPLLGPLARTGLVVILVVFILLQREELRDRFIRLISGQDFHRTTAAMSDAATRLSSLFLTLTLMNVCYGAVMAAALWLLGIPSPILWGILAGLMRYVPYIGSFVAAAFPVVLAAAVDPGWSLLAMTLALYIVGELLMGQVMEPWLLGGSTGLTPLAVVASASFWTWLWGPIGLLLAIPLTVCLIVLGRHVEQLSFLYVLLGDEPALTPPQRYYQRMLAGDVDEITYGADQYLKTHSLVDYFDNVALPALVLAQEDARRDRVGPDQLEAMRELTDELLDDLDDVDVRAPVPTRTADEDGEAERANGAKTKEEGSEPEAASRPIFDPAELPEAWRAGSPVVCVGMRNALDTAGAEILAFLVSKHGIGARVLGPEDVSPARIADQDLAGAQLVVLSSPDATQSPAYTRLIVRRLVRRNPDLQFIVGAWGETAAEDVEPVDRQPRRIGRMTTVTSFGDALGAILAAPYAESDKAAHRGVAALESVV